MGKPTTYLNEEDEGELFNPDDFDSSDAHEPETRKREQKMPHHRHAARQRLDSRKEELWLKQQLTDWDDELTDVERAD